MSKKIFYGIAVCVVAAMAAWNVNFSSQTKGMSDVSLANIEALAQSEGGGDCRWRTEIVDGCGGWALCDCNGIGYNCTCGDAKWYPD